MANIPGTKWSITRIGSEPSDSSRIVGCFSKGCRLALKIQLFVLGQRLAHPLVQMVQPLGNVIPFLGAHRALGQVLMGDVQRSHYRNPVQPYNLAGSADVRHTLIKETS